MMHAKMNHMTCNIGASTAPWCQLVGIFSLGFYMLFLEIIFCKGDNICHVMNSKKIRRQWKKNKKHKFHGRSLSVWFKLGCLFTIYAMMKL